MKAIQRPDNTNMHDLKPGEWCWQVMDMTRRGGPADHRAFSFHTPNPSERAWGLLNQRPPGDPRNWAITGDGDTITVSPSIHNNPGAGEVNGEWHGFLTNGVWQSC